MVLKEYGITDRTVWVADSFEGLPVSSGEQYDADKTVKVDLMNYDNTIGLGLAVPVEKVQKNFDKFGLLDEQVQFLKGWFKDTLPTAPIEKISLLRLDGDMYESTMDALNALYHKVSPGGYVIVDDYNAWPHAKQAIDDFRAKQNIEAKLIPVDRFVVYWQVSQD
jgi:hypothetical protein